MNKVFASFVFFGSMVAACSGGSPAAEAPAGTGHLRIETPCAVSTDCPTGFSCGSETENGTTKTFCESDDEVKADGTGAQCPAGFEQEDEHGSAVCKPHGGDDHGGGGARNDGESANSGSQNDGNDDAAGSDDGAGHDGNDGAGGSDDGAGHDGNDGAGGSDDGAGHDGAGGNDDSGRSGHG